MQDQLKHPTPECEANGTESYGGWAWGMYSYLITASKSLTLTKKSRDFQNTCNEQNDIKSWNECYILYLLAHKQGVMNHEREWYVIQKSIEWFRIAQVMADCRKTPTAYFAHSQWK